MIDRFIESKKLRKLHEKENLIRLREECRMLLVSCLGIGEQDYDLPCDKNECIKVTQERIASSVGPLFAKRKVEPIRRKYNIKE